MSKIFQPFRAVGVVSGDAPFSLTALGARNFATVPVGNAFHVYDCADLRLSLVSAQVDAALACVCGVGECTVTASAGPGRSEFFFFFFLLLSSSFFFFLLVLVRRLLLPRRCGGFFWFFLLLVLPCAALSIVARGRDGRERREREREKERDRQTDRQTETDRQRGKRERERERG